jgi:hypothetical protein
MVEDVSSNSSFIIHPLNGKAGQGRAPEKQAKGYYERRAPVSSFLAEV